MSVAVTVPADAVIAAVVGTTVDDPLTFDSVSLFQKYAPSCDVEEVELFLITKTFVTSGTSLVLFALEPSNVILP